MESPSVPFTLAVSISTLALTTYIVKPNKKLAQGENLKISKK